MGQYVFALVKVCVVNLEEEHVNEDDFEQFMDSLIPDVIQFQARVFLAEGSFKAWSFKKKFEGYMPRMSWNQIKAGIRHAQAGLCFDIAASHVEFKQLTQEQTRCYRSDLQMRGVKDIQLEKPGWEIMLDPGAVQLFDTQIIAIIGPHRTIRREGPIRHAVAAAAWPQAFEEIDGIQMEIYIYIYIFRLQFERVGISKYLRSIDIHLQV